MDNNTFFQSEIHKLLKLGPDLSKAYEPETPVAPIMPGVPLDLPIADLPVMVTPAADNIVPDFTAPNNTDEIFTEKFQIAPFELTGKKPLAQPTVKVTTTPIHKSWTSYLVYPVVFVVAFSLFYGVLNFGALSAQVEGWFAKSEDEVILKEDLAEYYAWINGYFFAVGDKEKLEPNKDIDADGLTNLDEFKIKTNPTIADSDNDGTNDGVEVINGTNPWGAGKNTKKQVETLEKADLIQVNNRISFNAAANSGTLQPVKDTDNFDLAQSGRLSIPRLNIQVPLIWTQDPAQFDNDLTRGVVHYPGTALPGEKGIVYISGHSSDYFWKKHAYRQVFAKINALEPGDDIFVDVYGKDGKIYNYRYTVVSENIYAPDDQRQFIDHSGTKLSLSTCWPIGTQKDRYVVTAELQK